MSRSSWKNYAALRCYTSANQYKALFEIKKSKSIMGLIVDGNSSKTLGSLIRNQWIQERQETGEDGVMRACWFLTADGENAASAYEKFQEQERLQLEKQEKGIAEFQKQLPAFMALADEVKELEIKTKTMRNQMEAKDWELRKLLWDLPDWRQRVVMDQAVRDYRQKKESGVQL